MQAVETGQWACEAALWTAWAYLGLLRAKTTSCTILKLDCQKFQNITCQFISADSDPRKYGKAFIKHVNSKRKEDLTGLYDPSFDDREFASDAMPMHNMNG